MSGPPQTPQGVPARIRAGASALASTARQRSQRIIVSDSAVTCNAPVPLDRVMVHITDERPPSRWHAHREV
jgi:hypothetical protein